MLRENTLEPLGYDDILFIPKATKINSRDDVKVVSSAIGAVPIFSAPMKNISEPTLVAELCNLGGVGVLHRFFEKDEDKYSAIEEISKNTKKPYGISVGVNDLEGEEKVLIFALNRGCKYLVVDTASGYMQKTIDAVKHFSLLKNTYDFKIIAGNVVDAIGCEGLIKAGADIIRVNIGSGCFVAGTRILMANGTYKDIEKINVDDRIIDGLGNPTKVLCVKNTGTKRVIRYKNAIYYDWTYCTPDHLHRIYNFEDYSDKHASVKKLANCNDVSWDFAFQFSKKKYLTYPNKIYFDLPKEFEIDLKDFAIRESKVFEESEKIFPSYDLGYLFGTFLGDGNADLRVFDGSTCGSTRWYFGKEETRIAEKVASCCKKVLGKEGVIKEGTSKNVLSVELYYQCFTRFLQSFGKRGEKHLPEEYWCGNEDYLKGIVDGLIDSDGHVEKYGRFGVHNTSKKIIELFSICCYLLYGSFPSSIRNRKSAGKLKNCNESNLLDSYISRLGPSHAKKHADFYTLVEMIEKENIDTVVPVYDIEVESDDHSFIANNVVVHNSQCLTSKSISVGCPPLTAIKNCSSLKSKYPSVIFLADGGIYTPGHILQSLAFGADGVMMGSLFGRAFEAENNGLIFGMSSFELQDRQNKTRKSREGKATFIPSEEMRPLKDIFNELAYGLKSGLSYLDCDDINKLHSLDIQYIRVNK